MNVMASLKKGFNFEYATMNMQILSIRDPDAIP